MFKFLKHKIWVKTYLLFLLVVGIVLWYFFIRVPDYKLEQLRIYFPEESYNQLSGYADNALDKGYLKREEDDYVPGNIVYRNEMIDDALVWTIIFFLFCIVPSVVSFVLMFMFFSKIF